MVFLLRHIQPSCVISIGSADAIKKQIQKLIKLLLAWKGEKFDPHEKCNDISGRFINNTAKKRLYKSKDEMNKFRVTL